MTFFTRTSLVLLCTSAGLFFLPRVASGFCGFYVGGADTKLYNNATTVVMMREGTRTVLSMQNNYQGPPENFAMVVPVPVVLEESNVKTLPRAIFDRVDKLAAPRLVEYWEQDPCRQLDPPTDFASGIGSSGVGFGRGGGGLGTGSMVVVEAEFSVGEYDIVILSAKDALALETWLTTSGYKIPAGAAKHLRPYVERGQKFFVAKVDIAKVKYNDGMATLSPLRMHYDSDDFSLPIRLGLINAKGAQDLIVHILAPNQRYEVANYDNVTIPTNLSVRDSVRTRFGEFYAALFDATVEKNPKSVVTEYSWDSGTCDPCPDTPLSRTELSTLGLDVLREGSAEPRRSVLSLSRPVVAGTLDKDIIRRFLRRVQPRLRQCHQQALGSDSRFSGSSRLEFVVSSKGEVEQANVSRSPKGNAAAGFKQCVEKVIRGVTFPKSRSGTNRVQVDLRLRSGVAQRGSSGFVLTRLHARYTANSVGEDLIFKLAEPIRGGQGGAMPNDKGALSGGRNTFQGRYIIHHPWTGQVSCESPNRGVWGGPPAGEANTSDTKVAQNLAFAPRGAAPLMSMVAEPIVALEKKPMTQAAGTPNTTPNTTPNAAGSKPISTAPAPAPAPMETEPGKRSKGCAASDMSSGAVVLVILGLLLALTRRRRANY